MDRDRWGQSKTEWGQDVEGSGHGMAKGEQANKAGKTCCCRRTQPADDLTGTGLEAQPQTIHRYRLRSKTTATDVGRPLAVKCRLVEGVRWCWPLKRRARTYPTCLPPTYRLRLSPSIPTPLICKTQFSPNLFFCFYFHFLPPHSKFIP